jgi:hypothetical protein
LRRSASLAGETGVSFVHLRSAGASRYLMTNITTGVCHEPGMDDRFRPAGSQIAWNDTQEPGRSARTGGVAGPSVGEHSVQPHGRRAQAATAEIKAKSCFQMDIRIRSV